VQSPHQALVVVESHFGNTVALADAVAATLRAAGVQTTVWMAHEAATTIPPGATLILLAGPTHDHGLSTPTTRKRAAGIGAKDSTDSAGLVDWLAQARGGREARVVTFGTADSSDLDGGGTAAEASAALALECGFVHVEQGPSFAVVGVAGPLAPGELQRARQWADSLGAELTVEAPSRAATTAAARAERADATAAPDQVRDAAGQTAADLRRQRTQPSATELARQVAAGQVSARELVQEAIDRIEANRELNLLAYDRFEAALAEAAEPREGPFAGVPLLLKDLGCEIEGVGTSMGSALLKRAGLVASEDAELVRRLKAAGFIIVGRTTSPEFGISSSTESAAFGITHNPWGSDRSAGGSSGGSASAVAAGIVPMAQGSDGAGSLRMPAALCGVSALKPSHGRISQAPDWEVMMGHNDNGAVARHVIDLAGFLDAVDGSVAGDPAAHRVQGGGSHAAAVESGDHPRPLRVGLFLQPSVGGVPIAPAVLAAVEEAGRVLSEAGHVVEDSWPAAYDDGDLLEHFIDAIAPTLVDLLAGLEAALGRTIDPAVDLEPVTQYWYERGLQRSAGDLAADLRWLGNYRRRLTGWWADGWDLLVGPSFPAATRPLRLPEDGGRLTRRNVDLVRATVPFNTSGQPALTVPVLLTEDGPIGVQLVGAPGHDRLMLVAAAQMERATGCPDWYPPSF
jgi:amidase